MNMLDPLYALAGLLTAPVWSRKARADWPARFGRTAPLPGAAAGRPRLLIHAVSVGEVGALRSLVPLLTAHAEVVISVGTDTGIARARELFGGGTGAARVPVVRYPLDFSFAVRRFLDAVRPDAVALVELELWPTFIRACRRRSIPVAVINGRLSSRSFKGYRRLRPFLRSTFASLDGAAVQDETYAERFIAMGVPADRCTVTGSMKWDAAAIADSVAGADALGAALGIDRGRPLVVAGSTGPGQSAAENEEALMHAACLAAGPEVQLLCAPRRPERFDEAAAALPGCVRRSVVSSAAGGDGRGRGSASAGRFLLDTIGELRAAYALADVAVVGRSFFGLHGSDPIEPIALGKATIIGPAYGDFGTIVEAFRGAEGIVVCSGAEVGHHVGGLLSDPARRRALGERGRACIRAHQGASQRHADLLWSLARAGGR